MTIRVLAVIAEAATAPACLDAAQAAARVLKDATIKALHVVSDPSHMNGGDEEISIQQLRELREGTAETRAAATRAAYHEWAKQHPDASIPMLWQERVGPEEENVQREAQLFDVLVLARSTNLDGADALNAAFYHIKRPFFLVPSNWRLPRSDGFAEHVVIAWNGMEGCRTAVNGALPWLALAKDVTILLIDEDFAAGDAVAKLLDDQRIHYRIQRAIRNDEYLGNQIAREAHILGADLLVMGAYRHNEFVEWLLGGTTRHALASMDLPLFLAH